MTSTVKIKGKRAYLDGQAIATIDGWRDPSGLSHRPYTITGANGHKVTGFAYAECARNYVRWHPAEFQAEPEPDDSVEAIDRIQAESGECPGCGRHESDEVGAGCTECADLGDDEDAIGHDGSKAERPRREHY